MSYIEDQDQWWFSGIFRSVQLFSRPSLFIQDYEITSKLECGEEGKYNQARVTVEVSLVGKITNTTSLTVMLYNDYHASIQNPDYLPSKTTTASLASLSSNLSSDHSEEKYTFNLSISNPKLWSCEDPYLYRIVLCLGGGDNINTNQYESCRVGLINVCIEGGILKVNGERIVIRGVNRHEHHPILGKAVDEDSMIKDVLLMKQHHFNAVRTCHYPNADRFYEICTEYGLYVCDEANIETHGDTYFPIVPMVPSSRLANDPWWREVWMSRIIRMVERDKNYPSIIFWSLGNESGAGFNTRAQYNWVKKRSPQRLVQYEGGGSPDNVSDVWAPMYSTVAEVLARASNTQEKRPLIMCEYTHAMGNSNGYIITIYQILYNYLFTIYHIK